MNHAIFRDGYDKFHLHELKKIILLPWPAGIINLPHFRCLPLMFYHGIRLTVIWKTYSRFLFKISNHQILFSLIINQQIILGVFVLLYYILESSAHELLIWLICWLVYYLINSFEWHLSLDFKGLYVSLSSCLSLELKRRPFSFSELPNAKASNPRFKSFFDRPQSCPQLRMQIVRESDRILKVQQSRALWNVATLWGKGQQVSS